MFEEKHAPRLGPPQEGLAKFTEIERDGVECGDGAHQISLMFQAGCAKVSGPQGEPKRIGLTTPGTWYVTSGRYFAEPDGR